MVQDDDRAQTSPSRRSVVKGAAWAAPVVLAAQAAPALAASQASLTFTGRACKLPGNATDIYKGYVFELIADNGAGPSPRDAVTVIESISANGIREVGGFVVVVRGGDPVCSCGPCTPDPLHEFCTPEGTVDQQVLIFTSTAVTGNSAAAAVTVTYRVFDCNGTSACGTPSPPQTASTLVVAAPPWTPGGGSCLVPNISPLPR